MVPEEVEAASPDVIQICPWFLDYAMHKNAQYQDQFSPGRMAKMIADRKWDEWITNTRYTPIDLFQLFDKVIVHEVRATRGAILRHILTELKVITHPTRQRNRRYRRLRGIRYVLQTLVLSWADGANAEPGWKNCRRLSTHRGEVSPHRNAGKVPSLPSSSSMISNIFP